VGSYNGEVIVSVDVADLGLGLGVRVRMRHVQSLGAKQKREKVNVNKHDVQQVIADVHQTKMYRYSLSLHSRISGMGL